MQQLIIENAANKILECSNSLRGMQQKIIENAAIDIRECSSQLIIWSAAI